jgi:glucose-6-phosphate isomerase
MFNTSSRMAGTSLKLQRQNTHHGKQLYDTEQSKIVLKDLFAQDPKRFSKFFKKYNSTSGPDVTMLVDLSKNLITEPVLETLLSLAREAKVEEYRDKMFAGEHINTSEDRAVLHVALRNFNDFKIAESGADEVSAVLDHMKEFTEAVRSGGWKGYTGKAINTIVNIGIGGSDLGPVMVTEALKPYAKRDLTAHFVSNIDGTNENSHCLEVNAVKSICTTTEPLLFEYSPIRMNL